MSVAYAARTLFGSMLDFVYPPVCLLCTERIEYAEEMVCSDCFKEIPRNHEAVLSSADKKLKKKYFSFVIWRFEYSDDMRTIVHFMKFHEYRDLALRIADEMAVTLGMRSELKRANVITAVPLHRTRLRERGFNQSAIIAERIAEFSDIHFKELLVRTRNNPPQSSIKNREERHSNVKNAFKLAKHADVKGKRIILIDDVVTSGATVNECGRMLERAGAHEVMVLSAAYVFS